MSKVQVSVIIPVYNHARYLGEAIESVLAQSVKDIEIIVVNDGSTDATAEVMARYVDHIVPVHQENSGPSAARNAGLELATGQWVLFLDGDDYLPAEAVSILLAEAERSGAGWVAGGFRFVDQEGADLPENEQPKPFSMDGHARYLDRLLFGNYFPIHTNMILKKRVDDVGGFDRSIMGTEDWDLWIRVALAGCGFSYTNQVVACYRQLPGSVSANRVRMARCNDQVLGKLDAYPGLESSLGCDMDRLRLHLTLRSASSYSAGGDMENGRRCFHDAVRCVSGDGMDESAMIRLSSIAVKLNIPEDDIVPLLRGSRKVRGIYEGDLASMEKGRGRYLSAVWHFLLSVFYNPGYLTSIVVKKMRRGAGQL